MFDRTEIAEAYFDAPTPAHFGLIDLILSDALFHPGDPAFESFRKAITTDGSKPDGFGAGDVAEALAPLIDAAYPERPIGWHFQRALHRIDLRMEPQMPRAARAAVEAHRTAVTRWADEHTSGFLYAGLSLIRDGKEALDHLLWHGGYDLEVAAFCDRSPAFSPASCDPALVERLVHCTLFAITQQGKDDGTGEITLGVDHSVPGSALRWLETAVRERRDFLTLLGLQPVPVSVVEVYRRPAAPAFGDQLFRHNAGLYTRDELDRDYPDVVPVDAEPELPDTPSAELPHGRRVVFRLASVRPPADAAKALEAVIQIASSNPHAAGAFVGWVGDLATAPDDVVVRRLAGCGWPILVAIIERGWLAPLAGAEELVPVASAIPHPAQRVHALVALGRPAASALGDFVDEALAGPSGGRDYRELSVGQIADVAMALGLPFWEKRLERPGVFPRLWSSTRLREAFTLRPEPVYRIIRRATKRADKREGAIGIQVLAALHTSWETFSLRPVADEVVLLLAGDNRLDWNTKFNLLANAGSPEALTALMGMAESGKADDVAVEAALFDDAWNALAPTGRVDARLLANALLDTSFEVSSSAAAAVVALLADELGEPDGAGSGPLEGFGRSREANLVFILLGKHRRSLPAELVEVSLRDLEGHVTAGALAAFRRNESMGELPREVPWEHLPDDDLGHLVAEIGAWVAARVDWPNLNVPALLGRALRAQHRRVLAEHADAILTTLGDRWPTRRLIADTADGAGIELPEGVLDRCADEALPPVFRAGLIGLPNTIETEQDARYSEHHWLVRWVFETAWQHSPELLARHLLPEFEGAAESRWKRGLALSLVALREPVGTSVADALTAAMHQAETEEARDFYRRQRDTFARESVAREQTLAPWMRTREAWTRLRRAARVHRGG